MNQTATHLAFLRPFTWSHALLIGAVVVGCAVLILVVRALVRAAATRAPSHRRLLIPRAAPIARLVVGPAGPVLTVPLLVDADLEGVIALLAPVQRALGVRV